jgi:hypothetical protein
LKTYAAGKHDDRELRYAGTREWVFPLLPTRKYRDRLALLSGLELRRRSDCEPTLRALITNDWTPESIHHIGWCDSCRTAGLALGMGTPAAAREVARPIQRRAAFVALAAGAVIAATAVGAQTLGNPLSGSEAAVRGGISHLVHQISPSTPAHPAHPASGSSGSAGASGSSGSSGSSGASGSGTPTTPATTPIVPLPRAKPASASRAHHAHTVVVPAARGQRAELPLTL